MLPFCILKAREKQKAPFPFAQILKRGGKMRKKINLKAIAAALTCSFLIASPALAEDNVWEINRMPDNTQDTGTLTINFASEKGGKTVPLGGASISVYQVAQLHTHGGSADFDVLPQYVQTAGEKIDIKDAGDSTALAEKLDKAKSKGAMSAKTDSGGTAKFSSLPAGMYLVVEEGKSGASAKYETFAPYLISVPLAENGKWNYNVVSAPKTTPSELVETPAPSNPGGGGDNNTALTHSETTSTNRIKTGDTNNPAALLLTTLSGAFAAVVAFFMMKRKKKI